MNKKIYVFVCLILIMFAFDSSAQIPQNSDWADFSYYSDANSKVDHRPLAVFIGDSITDHWDLYDPQFFLDNDILCRGISGQTTSQMLVRFRKDVLAHHPKYVLIMAGTNDIARNTGFISVENIVGNIKSMCEIAKSNKIRPIIVSITPGLSYPWRPEIQDVPETIIEVNALLKEYAESCKFTYVDLHSALKTSANGFVKDLSDDGIHPNMKGYMIMEPIILKNIK